MRHTIEEAEERVFELEQENKYLRTELLDIRDDVKYTGYDVWVMELISFFFGILIGLGLHVIAGGL